MGRGNRNCAVHFLISVKIGFGVPVDAAKQFLDFLVMENWLRKIILNYISNLSGPSIYLQACPNCKANNSLPDWK